MKLKNILIVEDEPYILDIYQELLTSEGIAPLLAKNGQEAYELLARGKKVDLILLDIMMPRLSGIELLRKIKKNSKIAPQKVILLTNLPDREIIDQCYELGALGMIMKSDINPDQLIEKINEILEKKGLM